MTPEEFQINLLQREVAAAETEVRECKKKLLNEILEYFKHEHIAKKDIERIIRGML